MTKAIPTTKKSLPAAAMTPAIPLPSAEPVKAASPPAPQRRSRPLAVLFLLVIVMVLAGTVVWLYRDQDIAAKNLQINDLKQQIANNAGQQAKAEAERQAEAARYQSVTAGGLDLRLPSSWRQQPSQYPADETVYGDTDTSLQVISGLSRNSIRQFIPKVDFIWQLASGPTGQLSLRSQSQQCDRFDTTDDASSGRREHNGFQVYCDDDGGRLVIAALADPQGYGAGSSNTYFIYTVHDVTRANANEFRDIIQSARMQD